MGKSGSGKSTLLNLISGIDQADQGRVWLDGQDLTALDDRQRTLFRRHKIGFIFQFFNLIPTLTVLENVILPAELSGRRLRRDWVRSGGTRPAHEARASPNHATRPENVRPCRRVWLHHRATFRHAPVRSLAQPR